MNEQNIVSLRVQTAQVWTEVYLSPVVESKTAVLSATWELSRASIVNLYMMFGDRELTEPITVFGPNVT